MDRRVYGKGQVVKATEQNAAFDGSEDADRNLAADTGVFGICAGLDASESAPPALTVEVIAGAAYDETGQRVQLADPATVDVSVDLVDNPTTVLNVGNTRWLAVLLRFVRANTDNRVIEISAGGTGESWYHIQAELAELVVRQGAEDNPPTKPTISAGELVVCHVLLAYGDTEVIGTDLHTDSRDVVVRRLMAADIAPVGDRIRELDAFGHLNLLPNDPSWVRVETNGGAASDDLTQINGGLAGQLLILTAADKDHTVVVQNGSGNIVCGSNFSLDNDVDIITLMYDGVEWLCVSKQDNG